MISVVLRCSIYFFFLRILEKITKTKSNNGMKKIITGTNHVDDWVPIFGLYRIAIVAKIKPKV